MATLTKPAASMSNLFWDMTDETAPPAGTYLATCIDVQDKFGVERHKFEDPNTMEKVDLTAFLFGVRDPAGAAYKIASRAMRISGNEKSALYGFLRSWLGKAPQYGWDYCSLKGTKAMLTVDHETRRDGNGTYPVIVAVTPVPAGFGASPVAPAAVAPKAVPVPQPAAPAVAEDIIPF